MENRDNLEELKHIYADVSEWLKFLEAKHAGLFAVWTAVIIALFSTDQFYKLLIWKQVAMVILACVGILISAIALVPFLNQQKILKKCIQKMAYNKYKGYKENTVFYTATFVSTYNTDTDYRNEAFNRYKAILESRNFEDLDDPLNQDYMNQIIDVSTVGSIKAYLFNVATKYLMLVMAVGILTIIVA